MLAKFQIGNSNGDRSRSMDEKRFELNGIRPSGLPIEIRDKKRRLSSGGGEGEEAAIDN